MPSRPAWAVALALRALVALALAASASSRSAFARAASGGTDQTGYLIDDFDSPAALQAWRFYTRPGSPAAGGGLTLGPGHRGQGAVLTYRLPCDRGSGCGGDAEALWRPASPLPARHDPAISLWVRFPPEVDVSVVARDTSGQTLRFPIRPSIEHVNAGDWQYVVVPLADKPTGDAAGKASGRMKGRLVEAGILVQARIRAIVPPGIVQGSVSFDEVRLRESSGVFHVDATAEAQPPPPEAVDLTHRLGVNIHLLRDDHALDLAREAGFGFVRMDMTWSDIERRGRYRFFAYDALLRSLDARGMGALWILDYGHPEHGGSVPRTPQDVAAFGRFAEAAAAHFKGRNVRYEVWNEPNQSQFWAGSPNASEYAALLREGVAGIRRGDPLAKVSSGGVSRIDTAFLSRAIDPSLAAGLTAIGVHPYRRTGPETVAPELGFLRDGVARALGDRVEIWDTEWGYSSADAVTDAPVNGHSEAARRRQAGLAVREILTVWIAGFPLAVWYDLRDDGTDANNPEHNYGLLDSSGNEKPAMQALRTLMGAASGRKYAGMIGETPAGAHAMRLDGSTPGIPRGDAMLIVWTDQPGRQTVEFTKHDLISATDLMGQPIRSKEGANGQARVEINDAAGPIYLLWAADSHGARAPSGPSR